MIVAWVILTHCQHVTGGRTDGFIIASTCSALHSKLCWRAVKTVQSFWLILCYAAAHSRPLTVSRRHDTHLQLPGLLQRSVALLSRRHGHVTPILYGKDIGCLLDPVEFKTATLMFETLQDSWAIAKTTARCAQYMGALKSFESPHYAPGYFSRNL